MMEQEFIPIKSHHFPYLIDEVVNFYININGDFIKLTNKFLKLEKSINFLDLSSKQVYFGKYPVYINEQDRKKFIFSIQKDLSSEISKIIESGNITNIRPILGSMLENALELPDPSNIHLIKNSLEDVIGLLSSNSNLIKEVFNLSSKRYSTVEHSINVCGLVLNFCNLNDYSLEDTLEYGIAAFFHDIGKAKISEEILDAPRKLTDDEFKIMKRHPSYGHFILKKAGMDDLIKKAALEHHVKLDGSGYPKKLSFSNEVSQLIAISDIYEALTNSNRLYRQPEKPFETLKIIQTQEINSGKLSNEIFEKFAYSLIGKKSI